MLKEIFERAERYGLKKGAIGMRAFGRQSYGNVYTRTNPTQETIDKIRKAVDELIEEKLKKMQKK